MLIPIDKKPDWRNPPLITLLLLLVNCLVYYGLQFNDNHREQTALDYYFSSALPDIELPAYQQYLYGSAPKLSPDETSKLFWEMQADGDFLVKLKNDQIITPGIDEYPTWKPLSQQFNQLLGEVISYSYSLKTAEPTLLTLFTHMFLHADSSHLIGNMIFLFLFGFVVEITLGRKIYLAAYLLSGVLSGVFDIVLNPGSGLWGLGASGAISGLAGMYTVLFGMRKIRFFYTVLFYFDYIKAPAIIMLPFWLGYEIYQQVSYPDSGINNLAHIGGMLAGAFIAWLLIKYTSVVNVDYLDEEQNNERLTELMATGMAEIARMDVKSARQTFATIAEEYPDNIDARVQLFNLYKSEPGHEQFHTYANQLLSLANINRLPDNLLYNTYMEYAGRAQPAPRLKSSQLLSLALRFIKAEHLDEAENIVLYLLKNKPDLAQNADGLAALFNYYRKKNNARKSQYYYSLLQKCYPGHRETQQIQQLSGS